MNAPSTDSPRPHLAGSSDRVEDLEAALSGFSPDIRPPQLPGSDVSFVVEDTAIGRMLLATNQTGALVASAFVPSTTDEDVVLSRLSRMVSPRVLRQPGELDEVRRELEAFLSGASHGFTVRTDLALATPFQRVVLPRLAVTVGYGTRTTYGQLAAAVSRPAAARAVGAALGSNPLCVVLPCHRVVASSGALTGYAGGLEAKRFLLDLEAGSAA